MKFTPEDFIFSFLGEEYREQVAENACAIANAKLEKHLRRLPAVMGHRIPKGEETKAGTVNYNIATNPDYYKWYIDDGVFRCIPTVKFFVRARLFVEEDSSVKDMEFNTPGTPEDVLRNFKK